MSLGPLIDRMIAAGISAGEAGAIAAEIYAAGVASASTRSVGAERTRRWRENKASQSDGKRHQTSHGDTEVEASPSVTERHKPSQCDADTVLYRDTKIKNSKRQNSERASRGTRIDPQWSPSSADRQAASDEGLSASEIDREALRFRDYWAGRAGSGGVKLDWAATWRNWVRSTAEKLGRSPVKPQAPGGVAADGKIEITDPDQLEAWDNYSRAKGGKSFPRNARGGWRFPSAWPPGYQPPDRAFDAMPLALRSMQ